MTTPIPRPQPFADDLANHLVSARFYGSKAEPITSITLVRQAPLPSAPHVLWTIVDVHRPSGHDLYQLFLGDDGTDCLDDPAVQRAVAAALKDGYAPGEGAVVGTPNAKDISELLPGDLHCRMIGGEQSNTSVIVDEKRILKTFRRLTPGMNPDVELLRGLSQSGCDTIASLRGFVEHDIDGVTYVTAMAQDFVRDAADGWKDMLARIGRGEDCTDDAYALGVATAKVHKALAESFGVQSVAGATVAERLNKRLESLVAQVPQLDQHAEQARRVYRTLEEHELTVQRVHGDLHLGQTLRQGERYILIDFEGEPTRSIDERRQPDCAVRDIAGLIRSLDYAAHSVNHPQAERWVAATRAALLDGYASVLTDQAPLAPEAALDAFVLDKALYEVAYEANNRPDWQWLPEQAVQRILRAS